jgi:hypothetical protein
MEVLPPPPPTPRVFTQVRGLKPVSVTGNTSIGFRAAPQHLHQDDRDGGIAGLRPVTTPTTGKLTGITQTATPAISGQNVPQPTPTSLSTPPRPPPATVPGQVVTTSTAHQPVDTTRTTHGHHPRPIRYRLDHWQTRRRHPGERTWPAGYRKSSPGTRPRLTTRFTRGSSPGTRPRLTTLAGPGCGGRHRG